MYQDNKAAAVELVDTIAEKLWSMRKSFAGEASSLQTVFTDITEADGTGRLAVIGDQGDSVLAGTPGDSMEIARFATEHHPLVPGLIPVFDPAAVEAAQRAGVGNVVTLALGANTTPGLLPMQVSATVTALTNGVFPNEGSYMHGVINNLGATAVLQSGVQTFVVSSRSPSACDPGLIRHAGKSPSDLRYIVVKSSNHFRLSFSANCDCFVAATPGLSSRKPEYLRHQKARPLYPIDDL
jgi:microcystin degradation protein MlrC